MYSYVLRTRARRSSYDDDKEDTNPGIAYPSQVNGNHCDDALFD